MTWSKDEWAEFSTAVEAASDRNWRAEAGGTLGTLELHLPDNPEMGVQCYAHPQFIGTDIRTPYGTRSGHTATTKVGTATLVEAAGRWVNVPGCVIAARVEQRNAAQAARMAADEARDAMISDLITFLAGQYRSDADVVYGTVWSDFTVRVTVGRAHLDVQMMHGSTPMIIDAYGPAEGVMLGASAINKWQACRLTDEHRKATP